MSEELIKEIMDILKSTRGFVLEQAPDVVQQWLTYSHTMSTVWGWSLLILAILIIVPIVVNGVDNYFDGGHLFASIVPLLLVVFSIANFAEAYKIRVAPKVVMLEKLSDLTTNRGCR